MNDNHAREDALELLHPLAVKAFRSLDADLKSQAVRGVFPFEFRLFETYRSPQRQEFVYRSGNSRARQYRSPHQFGLAADFVPWTKQRGFHWDVELHWWTFLKSSAVAHGLDVPLSWDRAHVEHPLWTPTRIALWG